jgi:hypothetical protein
VKKIIIAGHPTSDLDEILSLLNRSGMKPALPSRREDLLPEEITTNLCNAYKIHNLISSLGTNDFQQIAPAIMWNGLALDLEIANSSQTIWGWSDSRNVFFLDYWRKLDARAAFVLVYEDPHHVLLNAKSRRSEPLSEEEVQKLLINWAAYNGALLHFFLRNHECSVLVNAHQVGSSPAEFIQLLQERLKIPLQSISSNQKDGGNTLHNINPNLPPIVPQVKDMTEVSTKMVATNPTSLVDEMANDHAAIAQRYDIYCQLNVQPAYLQVFDELQAAASFPLESVSEISTDSETEWSALIAQPLVLARSLCHIHRQLRELKTKLNESSVEQELMFLQLHIAQEESERYYHQNRLLTNSQVKLPLYGAAKRVKQQLSYRLGNILVTRSRSIGGWLGMPFALLREVRRYNKGKKRLGDKKQPPLHQFKDARDAERIKQQLSYRLGHTLVTNTRSPIRVLKLPFAIMSELVTFKKRHRQNQK